VFTLECPTPPTLSLAPRARPLTTSQSEHHQLIAPQRSQLCVVADTAVVTRSGIRTGAPRVSDRSPVSRSRRRDAAKLSGAPKRRQPTDGVNCPRRGLSYDNECDSHSHDDQRICASNRDGEINVGHDFLRLELGSAVEHRTTPCNYLSWIHQAEDRNSFRGNVSKVYLTKKNLAVSTNAQMARFVRYVGGCRPGDDSH